METSFLINRGAFNGKYFKQLESVNHRIHKHWQWDEIYLCTKDIHGETIETANDSLLNI